MKLITSIISIIFLAASISKVFSQNLDSKLQLLIEQNKIKELRVNIESAKKKYPYLHTIYYVEAFIEKDGEKAITQYKKFVERFPESPYVVNAQYKIAQFYFAKGLYRSAELLLYQVINSYPDSPYTDDANYLIIQSLLALETTGKAKKEIKNFKKIYPHSPFKKFADYDLKQIEKQASYQLIKQNSQSTKDHGQNHTIQVGAFRNRENAVKQVNIVNTWGYTAEIIKKIIKNDLYYLVWIGEFETYDQALNFGEIFKKKYGLTFRVVKKESEL